MIRRGYTKGKGINARIAGNIDDREAWRQLQKLRELNGKTIAKRPFIDREKRK